MSTTVTFSDNVSNFEKSLILGNICQSYDWWLTTQNAQCAQLEEEMGHLDPDSQAYAALEKRYVRVFEQMQDASAGYNTAQDQHVTLIGTRWVRKVKGSDGPLTSDAAKQRIAELRAARKAA